MICPPGFFCFDRYTLTLVILGFAVLYYTLKPHTKVIRQLRRRPIHIINQQPELSLAHKRIYDPLHAPERTYPNRRYETRMRKNRMPINVSTRGEVQNYQQVGILKNDNEILPLYGKPTYQGSNHWNYYTETDNNIKLPINMDHLGQKEIYDNDSIEVPAKEKTYKATIYEVDSPKYIPYL